LRGFAHGRLSELAPARLLHPGEVGVFEKPGGAQRIDEVPGQLPHLELAGDGDQRGAQIEVRLQAIETLQTLHQGRRDDQHGVAEAVGIADEQPRMFGRGGRHEIQVHAQARQEVGHDLWYAESAVFAQQLVNHHTARGGDVERMFSFPAWDAHVGIRARGDLRPDSIHLVAEDDADGKPRLPVEEVDRVDAGFHGGDLIAPRAHAFDQRQGIPGVLPRHRVLGAEGGFGDGFFWVGAR